VLIPALLPIIFVSDRINLKIRIAAVIIYGIFDSLAAFSAPGGNQAK
jgi:hypothetical protein